jgi:acetyl-CoA acetyltransferase
MKSAYGDDTMPSTGENVADAWKVSREDQDAFAVRSQDKAFRAHENGRLAAEIVPVSIPQRKGDPLVGRSRRASPQDQRRALAKLKPIVRSDGTVTAGNASGVNDGAAAMIVASEEAARRNGLTPRCPDRGRRHCRSRAPYQGHRPSAGFQKLLQRLGPHHRTDGRDRDQRGLRCPGASSPARTRPSDDAPHVNPNGGAIALGHPLGMSGARLAMTATEELQRTGGLLCPVRDVHRRRPGIAMVIERV